MTRIQTQTPALLSQAAATSLVLALLTACASGPAPSKSDAVPARTATEQWSNRVKVTAQPDEILLAPHAQGLSSAQQQALDALLGRWLRDEGREIVVNAPIGGPNADVAGRMAFAARLRLVDQGAPPSAVRVVGYDAGGDPAAPLKVGYLHHEASIPNCGQYWENLTATRNNAAYENFGCAVAANMAAQVANPEDLVRPRDSTPASAQRRDTVLDKYRRGEVTASAKDEQAAGAVSKAVQ
jgi:pilus assembly protein CpaD